MVVYIAGFLGVLGGLFQSNPHPGYIKDNIFDEGMPSISKYLSPEIEKIAPGAVIGTGFINMIGYENLKINIYCPSEENVEIKKLSLKAYEAASKGLLKCKRLYNHTNHGPTSPNLVVIKTTAPSGPIGGVYNGEFCYLESWVITKWLSVQKEETKWVLIVKQAETIGSCEAIDYYITSIEKEQSAIGLDIWIAVDRVPTLEEGIILYKRMYEEIIKWAKSNYPNNFLMLKANIHNPSTRYGVAYHNIRNHVVCIETTPAGNGRKSEHYYKPNYLDDLVPVELRREYYK